MECCVVNGNIAVSDLKVPFSGYLTTALQRTLCQPLAVVSPDDCLPAAAEPLQTGGHCVPLTRP